MSPNLRIAYRFLTAKKRAMLMSLSCIILGVGLFVVTQATTGGFQELFVKTILGADGAIRIEDKIQQTLRTMEIANQGGPKVVVAQREGFKYIEGIDEPETVMKALRQFSNVTGCSQVLRGNVMVNSNSKRATGQVLGIYLDDHLSVSTLAHQIVQGKLDDFRDAPRGVLLGRMMAERLQIDVGDTVMLQYQGGALQRFRVSALYETGSADIDRLRIYMHLSEARAFFRKPTGATYIQVALRDKNRAPADAAQMVDVLGYSATPWQVREKIWLGVFQALRISSGITVSLFTLIAGIAMYNTLALIAMEKTKDIAILRSMGYTRKDITHVFLWQAAIVLLIGAALGIVVGAAVTFAVSLVPLGFTGIFATKTFSVAVSAWHYVQAVLTAIVIVMVASLVPSHRAARLEPGDVVRGTAQ